MVRFVDNSVKFVDNLSFFALWKNFFGFLVCFLIGNFSLSKLHKSAHFVP